MIDRFRLLLSGTFDNKNQAYSNPTMYAHIRVTHKDIGDGLFYGEQAYTYELNKPYRQFVLEPVQDGSLIRVINYEIKNKSKYLGYKNLEEISRDDLIKKDGCELIFKEWGVENVFNGGTVGCECIVNRGNKETYLESRVTLTPSQYVVIDRGFCVEKHTQEWGSEHGPFYFDKI